MRKLRPAIVAAMLALPLVAGASGQSFWLEASPKIDPDALPLGDGKFDTEGPRKGYLYACDAASLYFGGGAHEAGDWIHGKTWSAAEKFAAGAFVHGAIEWPNAAFEITTTDTERTFTGNGLPVDGTTGVYPTREEDPAYRYDTNPNGVEAQEVSFSVPRYPRLAAEPTCIGKSILGLALNGASIFGALDSQGRDENAYEMQDSCGGMPEVSGRYHYHAPSGCMPGIDEPNGLVGYAVDGFGIYGPLDASGNELVSADLDECHGTTTPIVWEGKTVSMYHYVLTRDYPYTITCFRGTPTHLPMSRPPLFPDSPMTWFAFLFWWALYGSWTSRGIALLIAALLVWRFAKRKKKA